MVGTIRRSGRLATKKEPARSPSVDLESAATPQTGAVITTPKNRFQPHIPAHTLTAGKSEHDSDTASQFSTSSPPTKKRRRHARRKRNIAPPKTWDELVAEHEQVEQDEDMSQCPMAYFCRGRGRGLPMKSTVERAWELYRQKQAEANGEANSTESSPPPPPSLPTEAPEEVVGLVEGAEDEGHGETEALPSSPKPEDGKVSDGDANKNEPPADDAHVYATNRYAPQLKIVNGKIAVNEETVMIDRGEINAEETAAAHRSMEVVDEGRTSRYINCMTYVNKKREKLVRWSMDDTVLFYELLARYGTDFNMIAEGFNGKRTRGQCKNKFKREEMVRPWLITRAMLNKPIHSAELASAPGTPKPPVTEAKSVPDHIPTVADSEPLDSNPSAPDTVAQSNARKSATPGSPTVDNPVAPEDTAGVTTD
ncbi:hypothetical protein H4R34_004382 [Dimargaris verticillata]|uniref:Myb-like domain-containing protein n=1 Tax=Dimargaris verticillata TaxID=2761393 RepID=A0A9W8B4G4_9FUNG|nr:hypothetical protein H4R34_004382 [Dimargaris verticillata]